MANLFFCKIITVFFIYCIIYQAPTMANPRTEMIYKQCGFTEVQNYTIYNENYLKALKAMEEEMKVNKFAMAQEGDSPNRVYVLAHCMKDLSEEDCATCFSTINTLIPDCFPLADSRVLFDGCFIRINNQDFYGQFQDPDGEMIRCSETLENSTRYMRNAKAAMNNLTIKAPDNGGYAKEDAYVTKHISVHTMANCWGNLDRDSCASCLKHARDLAVECFPSVEGRALMSGCFIRFSDYDFANQIRLVTKQDDDFPYLNFIVLACVLATVMGYLMGVTAYSKFGQRRGKSKVIKSSDLESPEMMKSLHFKYSVLEKSTNNFSESNKIGQGGFGEVYKGVLPDGREMAIKRLFVNGKIQLQEVCNEVEIIGQAHHKNLVRYLGCCLTNVNSLLVYEFLPNKSLDLILFDSEKKKELNWQKRFGVIKGTAEGLEYLHTHCQVKIIHRDIKASNVLLDLRHRPKIADFGLASFSMNDQDAAQPVFAGTLGYMAPEYLAQGKITEKVDVYSYGVLVLEIVSGTRNNKFEPEDSLDTLVTVTWKHLQQNTLSTIIDKSLEIDDDIEEILRVIKIGLLCTQESPVLRPSMTTVIDMLRKKDIELPNPSKPAFVVDSVTIDINSNHQRNYTATSIGSLYFDAQIDK